ncbi:MAG: PliI family lysozyme inhibitor of I-type lysozyme [Porticoccus sp.]|nr:PliI family lysozyme inhibitor of I-type lysozyme [Porticoccus sp.]
MTKTSALATIILLIGTLPAMASDRFIKKLTLPSGQTIVISEGEFEARSIGSFSIRLYQTAPAGDETTFFISGLINARDGFIEKAILIDIDSDKKPEVIVVIRSAGTGGYLSAYAFAISNDQKMNLISKVEDLQAEANPISALKKPRSR